jgi:predicted enzyme related to lactoylglutathione lyase
MQPLAAEGYLVSPHNDGRGVDTGLMPSLDGQPRTVPIIGVVALETSVALVREHGGRLLVESFTLPGAGRGRNVLDPADVLIGLDAYDSQE